MSLTARAQTLAVQRKCACGTGASCEACGKKKELQRKASGPTVGEVPESVYEVLRAPGQPLDAATRAFMEPRFGHDFSRVRVHTDARAAESARSVDAAAYTVGSSIVLGKSPHPNGSLQHLRLIAHELTHTVQNEGRGPMTDDTPLTVGSDSDGQEVEARRVAAGIVTMPAAVRPGIGLVGVVRRQRRNEGAGGCGICETPTITGSRVHPLIEGLFHAAYPDTVPEAPVPDPADQENGRLDLMRVIMTPNNPPNLIEIGEIKPDNDAGVRRGRAELLHYRDSVQRLFPLPLFTVGFLDVPAPAASLPYLDPIANPGCAQSLSVRNAKIGGPAGLYLYSCTPPRSQLSVKNCCTSTKQPQPVPLPLPLPLPVPIPNTKPQPQSGPTPLPVPGPAPVPVPIPEVGPQPVPAPEKEPGKVMPFPSPSPVPVPIPDTEPESVPIAARWSWAAVVAALAAIGIGLLMIPTVAACVLDPEPASKVALCGLTAAEFAALMLILNGPPGPNRPDPKGA